MTNKKKMYEVFITPIGELQYPWITAPDTRWDPDGVFQTKMRIPFEDAQQIIAQLEKARDDFFQTLDSQKQKNYRKADVFEEETDDEGNPTGNVVLKFKLKQVVTPKSGEDFRQKPVVVDKDGEPITVPVYGGTRAKVKGQIVPYTNAAQKVSGITLRMKGVEVHELVTSGGGDYWSDF